VAPAPTVVARGVTCRFGPLDALREVDFSTEPGQIHALLGPNGAGKTTLLRVLTGALRPSSGSVTVAGHRPDLLDVHSRHALGVAPAGDRSFYLRLNALDNLAFFGRMHGMRRRQAIARAWNCLEAVGLEAEARKRVGLYSQGMKKRLSVARALLSDAPALILDEATHDVDAEGAARIRQLASERAAGGTTVVWATQLLDEIRGFAHAVTVLHRGEVRFQGTVSALVRTTTTQRFFVRLRAPDVSALDLSRLQALVGERGTVDSTTDADHVHLGLRDGVVLGDVLASFTTAGVDVLSCREEQSLVEAALRRLTAEKTADRSVR
jgi:ABC-2 type transport system ATP-binding protein